MISRSRYVRKEAYKKAHEFGVYFGEKSQWEALNPASIIINPMNPHDAGDDANDPVSINLSMHRDITLGDLMLLEKWLDKPIKIIVTETRMPEYDERVEPSVVRIHILAGDLKKFLVSKEEAVSINAKIEKRRETLQRRKAIAAARAAGIRPEDLK